MIYTLCIRLVAMKIIKWLSCFLLFTGGCAFAINWLEFKGPLQQAGFDPDLYELGLLNAWDQAMEAQTESNGDGLAKFVAQDKQCQAIIDSSAKRSAYSAVFVMTSPSSTEPEEPLQLKSDFKSSNSSGEQLQKKCDACTRGVLDHLAARVAKAKALLNVTLAQVQRQVQVAQRQASLKNEVTQNRGDLAGKSLTDLAQMSTENLYTILRDQAQAQNADAVSLKLGGTLYRVKGKKRRKNKHSTLQKSNRAALKTLAQQLHAQVQAIVRKHELDSQVDASSPVAYMLSFIPQDVTLKPLIVTFVTNWTQVIGYMTDSAQSLPDLKLTGLMTTSAAFDDSGRGVAMVLPTAPDEKTEID